MLADHFADPLEWIPEGLAHADGVLDDFDNSGVPILAVAIIKYTVAAHHQVVGIPIGESCRNIYLFAASAALAFTIRQVCTA